MDLSRRSLLLGAAVAAAASQLPLAAVPAAAAAILPQESFSVRSSDGLTLIGDAKGPVGAPEILFIHGLRQSRLSWERQWNDPALARFRMVRFDLRGHGDSDKPADPAAYADMDRWADDIAAVIKQAGLKRPVLVGWSLGGFVTGAYLRKYGDSAVAGINLVDAVIKLSPDLLTPLAGRYAKSTSSHDLAERTAETADFLLACFEKPPTGADLNRMLVVNGMTARAVNEGFTRTTTPDLTRLFTAYRGPILLTHGVHDRLVKVEMSRRMVPLHADSNLSLYDGSGHSPFYEEPARYNRELAAFMRKATARRS